MKHEILNVPQYCFKNIELINRYQDIVIREDSPNKVLDVDTFVGEAVIENNRLKKARELTADYECTLHSYYNGFPVTVRNRFFKNENIPVKKQIYKSMKTKTGAQIINKTGEHRKRKVKNKYQIFNQPIIEVQESIISYLHQTNGKDNMYMIEFFEKLFDSKEDNEKEFDKYIDALAKKTLLECSIYGVEVLYKNGINRNDKR